MQGCKRTMLKMFHQRAGNEMPKLRQRLHQSEGDTIGGGLPSMDQAAPGLFEMRYAVLVCRITHGRLSNPTGGRP